MSYKYCSKLFGKMRREAKSSNDVTKILRKSMREKKRNDVMEREREREREN